jgi:hypothetical protein
MFMPRYYFDIRDGEDLYPDEEGLDLPDLRSAEVEAATSLAMMARIGYVWGPTLIYAKGGYAYADTHSNRFGAFRFGGDRDIST